MLGPSLQNILDMEQVGLALTSIRMAAGQLLRALELLRLLDIVHGDLKPDNILFTGRGLSVAKIIDFGMAQMVQSSTFYPIQILPFRAPEVLLELSYGTEVDLWSMGCILYTMLTTVPLVDMESEEGCLGRMVQIFGMPPESMLRASSNAANYFILDEMVPRDEVDRIVCCMGWQWTRRGRTGFVV